MIESRPKIVANHGIPAAITWSFAVRDLQRVEIAHSGLQYHIERFVLVSKLVDSSSHFFTAPRRARRFDIKSPRRTFFRMTSVYQRADSRLNAQSFHSLESYVPHGRAAFQTR